MPLYKGKGNIGRNIKELEVSGKPHRQAIAIALNVARKGDSDIPKLKSKKRYLTTSDGKLRIYT